MVGCAGLWVIASTQIYSMSLHLNLAQIGLHLDTDRQSSHHFLSSRVALRKGLDPNVVENCLNSLDVFRDLLQGIPYQKNRVVRDVCKNIDVKHYQEGDIIYDIGQKARAVFFCLTGEVSISIVKEVPKDPSQSDQRAQQNSYRNNDKLNTPKGLQNLTSMTISLTSTSVSRQQQIQKLEQEIDVIQMGQGFGQAQFISETTRTVKATAKLPETVIGKLELNHFTEVLENYKQRVYYKKRDMFQKCPLFADLPLNKLQFIINNTKPMTINISYQLVKEGNAVDTVYLVNKGQVSIWKTGIEAKEQDMDQQDENMGSKSAFTKSKSLNIQKKSSLGLIDNQVTVQTENTPEVSGKTPQKQSYNKVYSSLLKLKAAKHPIPLQKNNKVFMGLLSEGGFIGDMELAMGTPFRFNAVCRTEKAEVYYCDRRIILSQMTQQNIVEACKCYKEKQSYISEKINRYKCAKEKIQRQKQIDLLPPLTKKQIHLKRKLMHRHVQDKPSLIGHCSPRDIQKMILRKEKRVIKQPEVSKYPILELFPNHSVKKRSLSPASPSSFNPLSIVQTQGKKCITQFDEYDKYDDDTVNPELKRSQEFKKFKSMLIQIKPTKISLKDVKYGSHQQNMAVVGKILGRYRRCQSRLKSLSEVIDKIEKSRK